jgi:hypothetical protein
LSIDLPLGSSRLRASSNSAAIARVIRYRLSQLGVSGPEAGEETPLVDALMLVRDAGHEGTLSWTASITNEQTGDEFMVFLPEVELGNGVHRPVAVRLSGRYPRELDGLAALLTLDMAVVDVAWIGMKLRKLVDYDEPMGFLLCEGSGFRSYPAVSEHRRVPGATHHSSLFDAWPADFCWISSGRDGRDGFSDR